MHAFPLAVIVAILLSAFQTPATPAKAPSGCRTYPTTVIQTTTAPGVRIVQTTNGRFDPVALELRLDVRYESTPGSVLKYQKTIRYASVQDFVNEAALANPPLDLWQQAELSGGVTMTVTNTFDAQHRVTQTVTKQPSGTDTTTNTAWDSRRRPTASGTVRSQSAVSSFQYVYDENKRTTTHTVKTGSLTSVIVTEFDVNGVAIKGTGQVGPTVSPIAYQNSGFVTQCLKSPEEPNFSGVD